jgi:hypothetical protein
MASKPPIWLTATALLFAGVTNAHSHVHYCFDGQAPRAVMHHVDGLDHTHAARAVHAHAADSAHDDHASDLGDHDDVDLDVPNNALAKTVKHELPAVVAALLWTADPAPASSAVCALVASAAPAPDPRYSRPPLRAPPR